MLPWKPCSWYSALTKLFKHNESATEMINHFRRTYFDKFMPTCLRGSVFMKHSVCQYLLTWVIMRHLCTLVCSTWRRSSVWRSPTSCPKYETNRLSVFRQHLTSKKCPLSVYEVLLLWITDISHSTSLGLVCQILQLTPAYAFHFAGSYNRKWGALSDAVLEPKRKWKHCWDMALWEIF